MQSVLTAPLCIIVLKISCTYNVSPEDVSNLVTEQSAGTHLVFDSSTVEGLDWQRVLAWRKQFRAPPHRAYKQHIDLLRRNWLAAQLFKKFSKKMRRVGVPLTLSAGTLLGWYREGWIIAGDEDADLGLPRLWLGNSTASFALNFWELFYRDLDFPSKELVSTEFGVKVKLDGFEIDICVLDEYRENANGSFVPGCANGPCSWAFYLPLSPLRVCIPHPHRFKLAMFMGELVWVPWPPLAQLLPFYTEDGKTAERMMLPEPALRRGCDKHAAKGVANYVGPIESAPFRITPGLVPPRSQVIEQQWHAALRFRGHIDAERARTVLGIEAVIALALMLAAEPASESDWEAVANVVGSAVNVFYDGVWKVYYACSRGPCTSSGCRALVENELLNGGLWLREDMWPFWRHMSMRISRYSDANETSLLVWAEQCDWNSIDIDKFKNERERRAPASNSFVVAATALAFAALSKQCINFCARCSRARCAWACLSIWVTLVTCFSVLVSLWPNEFKAIHRLPVEAEMIRSSLQSVLDLQIVAPAWQVACWSVLFLGVLYSVASRIPPERDKLS